MDEEQQQHRQASPLAIDDLPHAFRSVASPQEGCSQLAAQPPSQPPLSAKVAGKKREASVSVDLPDDEQQQQSFDQNNDMLDECDNASSHHRPHHPQNHLSSSSSPSLTGFGVKGPPGGDCKRICLRHQRMVDGGARVDLQKVRASNLSCQKP